ncbi:MAG: molybdenum cofactor guanylyltransferase MobA [Pseudomonadota bacterium]
MVESIAGVVLAGGLSRRMGGGDKGLLDVAGQSMIGRVISRFKPQVSAVAINANGTAERFSTFGLPVIADPVDGFVGPLAGVLAGMRWAAEHCAGATHVATVSSDAPFLPADLVERLHAESKRQPENAIVLAASDGQKHPVIGLWPVHLADDLEAALNDGVRKVLRWTDRHGTFTVAFEAVRVGSRTIDPFFNANTPAELDEARALLRAET